MKRGTGMTKADRQAEYLRVLAETGSPVQARRAIAVGPKTISEWRRDPDFVEQVADAIEVAQDAIRAKVREMALAGDGPMLALSMKVIEPALRPAGTQVAVGVKVQGTRSVEDQRHERLKAMSDSELLAELERFHRDLQTRVEYGRHECVAAPAPAGDVVDVEMLPAPPAEPEALSGPENEPESGDEGAVDDLL